VSDKEYLQNQVDGKKSQGLGKFRLGCRLQYQQRVFFAVEEEYTYVHIKTANALGPAARLRLRLGLRLLLCGVAKDAPQINPPFNILCRQHHVFAPFRDTLILFSAFLTLAYGKPQVMAD
jgi:hypothetical protein